MSSPSPHHKVHVENPPPPLPTPACLPASPPHAQFLTPPSCPSPSKSLLFSAHLPLCFLSSQSCSPFLVFFFFFSTWHGASLTTRCILRLTPRTLTPLQSACLRPCPTPPLLLATPSCFPLPSFLLLLFLPSASSRSAFALHPPPRPLPFSSSFSKQQCISL